MPLQRNKSRLLASLGIAYQDPEMVSPELHIVDNGAGVAEVIRESLFQPFVSEGKQNGTGLGLTMAHVVAREHGGSVELLRSRPYETVFVLSLAQSGREQNQVPVEGWLEPSQ